MEDQLIFYFKEVGGYAIVLSLIINIIISILGIIPSFFLTAANILFFGFWYGTLISFIGEALGAIVSFFIYRKGFSKFSKEILPEKYPKVSRLLTADGRDAFRMILALRLFPYIPSGAINVFAALGKVSIVIFTLASTIGKIPALLIEAFSVMQIIEFGWGGKLILSGLSIYLFVIAWKKVKTKRNEQRFG